MVNMNILIPDGMKDWVDRPIPPDALAQLQSHVDEGLASGVSDENMGDILADLLRLVTTKATSQSVSES